MNDNNNTLNKPAYRNLCVTLTPLGNFFFGGRKLTEVEREKDYYIKSLYYPQQTVILGMLRQELLIQNNLFPLEKSNREKAARLIGESSFNPENKQQEFGVIEGLSPVFIKRKDNRAFHLLPDDYENDYKPEKEGKTFFNHPNAVPKEFLPNFVNYNAKLGKAKTLGSRGSNQENIKLDDIFITDEQIGIKKGKQGQTEEEGYYKQVFFRLAKGYSFSFYLRLKRELDNLSINFNSNFVFIGGERSTFRMEVKPEDENKSIYDLFDQTLPEFTELESSKIVLTGDAFVESEILNTCDFSVSGSVFFRNFRSYIRTTKNYWNLTNKENKETPFLGRHYNLLSRGSVLYYGNNRGTFSHLTRLLENPAKKKIGFNYYKIYPSQKEKGKE